MLASDGRWTAGPRTGRGAVTVIAEAAQGFEGDVTLGKLLVRGAASAGADLVKFQLVYVDELATPDYIHYELFKQLEMPHEHWQAIVDEARLCSIGIVFDVFGPRSLDLAIELGADAVKIHASDVFNHTLVTEVLRRAPLTFVSTGGVEAAEIEEFLRRHADACSRVTLLCGFQAEPTATSDNNLARLGALRARFPVIGLGFMDHADGDADETTWLAALAVPYGVTAIEKHLTLDRALCLEDYVSAATPDRFATFVSRLRAAEAAIGSADLALSPAETTYRRKALKSVVTTRPLASGAEIARGSVMLLRAPLADGRQPVFRLERVVGGRLVRDVPEGQPLYEDDLA